MFVQIVLFKLVLCYVVTIGFAKNVDEVIYDDDENTIIVDEVPFPVETDYESKYRYLLQQYLCRHGLSLL